jgi:hypothetical protein
MLARIFNFLLGGGLLGIVIYAAVVGTPSPDLGAAKYYGGLVLLTLFCLILIGRSLRRRDRAETKKLRSPLGRRSLVR